MKRTSALPVAALAAAITFGAAACSDDSPDASNDSDTTEATETTENTETTEASETTEAGGDTTEAPENTAEAPEAGDEPTVETATPVLVGLTEDEAAEAAEALGWEVRVMRRDGEDLPITMDLRQNRVNVEVTDGEVTEVVQIG
jgi:hypothetical protein